MSPVLYSVYVMEMLKDLDEKRLGIEVEGTWWVGLLYGDDIVLLARDQVELQVMLDVVGKYAKSMTMMVGGKGRGGERREWRIWKYSVSWSVV